ncbi:MAG: SAM-dependent methyltransferase [Chloroflexi bacterium]|nr:SAM-dependent methyltransferase [Chloroflexota bacterium]
MSRSSAMQAGSPPAEFREQQRALERAYLAESDPIRQSGFSGGPRRWRAEREPILEAVPADGDFLDIGCANGYLLQCLVAWAGERGIRLNPYGLDVGARLIDLAKHRWPERADQLWVGDAWSWNPPRRFDYVYTLLEYVPFLGESPDIRPGPLVRLYLERLLGKAVRPGGRLIVGSYGSRSRGVPPLDLRSTLEDYGFQVAGTAEGGSPITTRFAWVDRHEAGP